MEDLTTHADDRLKRLAAAAAHPLAELLECPQEVHNLLAGASTRVDFEASQVVFRQHAPCKGLYVVVSGEFVRSAERIQTRFSLGLVRPGELVELAAALCDGHHAFTLRAVSGGTILFLPIEDLHRAFHSHPPLLMRLLEELAREVSRAYITCSLSRITPAHRQANHAAHS
jgi:CRP-like cAMP-binding protein